jgi:Transcriptional regulatory protein, C terminal
MAGVDRERIFRFAQDGRKPFRLQVRGRTQGKRYFALFQGFEVVKGLSRQALELLHHFVKNPQKPCSRDEILQAISPLSHDNLVDKYVSELRDALGDDPRNPKFIGRVTSGYIFLPEVQFEGDLGAIEPYPIWDKARFFELLRELKRDENAEEDLRISTASISAGLEAFGLEELLQKRLRIKIIFMDPDEKVLVHAKYSRREDKKPAKCLGELKEQLEEIEKYAQRYRPDPENPHRATLEYAVSRLMPCGFVAHTRDWAILGILLAQTSYANGPMFEIHSKNAAWEALYADWKIRWRDARENSPQRQLARTSKARHPAV